MNNRTKWDEGDELFHILDDIRNGDIKMTAYWIAKCKRCGDNGKPLSKRAAEILVAFLPMNGGKSVQCPKCGGHSFEIIEVK